MFPGYGNYHYLHFHHEFAAFNYLLEQNVLIWSEATKNSLMFSPLLSLDGDCILVQISVCWAHCGQIVVS